MKEYVASIEDLIAFWTNQSIFPGRHAGEVGVLPWVMKIGRRGSGRWALIAKQLFFGGVCERNKCLWVGGED